MPKPLFKRVGELDPKVCKKCMCSRCGRNGDPCTYCPYNNVGDVCFGPKKACGAFRPAKKKKKKR